MSMGTDTDFWHRAAASDDMLTLVTQSLGWWGMSAATSQVTLLHISENASFLIRHARQDNTGTAHNHSILRLHRPNYQTKSSIQSELAWLDALSASDIVQVPVVLHGSDGQTIQSIANPNRPRQSYYAVMFGFIPGTAPDPHQPQADVFHRLGEIAAKLHRHVQTWQPPATFTRPVWDSIGVFGDGTGNTGGLWGDWRHAPHVTAAIRPVLEDAETSLRTRLASYGKRHDNWGLIHADMRLANVLVDNGDIDNMRLIDFDDCGFGWFMYDFAASISFMEDSPSIPHLKQAWLDGYQRQQGQRLGDSEFAMLDSFVLLRRMLLLAWLGGHAQADIAPSRVEDFARITAELAELYLHAADR